MADVFTIWAFLFIVWTGGTIGVARCRGATFWLSVTVLVGCVFAVFWIAAGVFGGVVWFILLLIIWLLIAAGVFAFARWRMWP